jgi:hypothetical protein
MEEKYFRFTYHHVSSLTGFEDDAFAESMIGKPFKDMNGVERGTIDRVTVSEEGKIVVSVKCEKDDYDILTGMFKPVQQSLSIEGVSS